MLWSSRGFYAAKRLRLYLGHSATTGAIYDYNGVSKKDGCAGECMNWGFTTKDPSGVLVQFPGWRQYPLRTKISARSIAPGDRRWRGVSSHGRDEYRWTPQRTDAFSTSVIEEQPREDWWWISKDSALGEFHLSGGELARHVALVNIELVELVHEDKSKPGAATGSHGRTYRN